MEGVILEEMKSFDFSAPVDEVIIFYDSDEDKTSPEIKQEKEDIEEHNCEQEQTLTAYSMPIIDDICEEDKKLEQKKRHHSEINNVKKIKNKKKQKPNPPATDRQEISSNHFTKTIKSGKEDNKLQVKESSHNDSLTKNPNRPLENNTHSKPQVNSNTETNGQINQANVEELSDYIKDIFDTLSQNLILSVEEYRSHIEKVKNEKYNYTSPLVQNSKRHYVSYKYHYYRLSYVAVVNIILPQEDKKNVKFTEEFLNKTVKYAKEKMNLEYSIRELEPHYYEMITWAKKQQEFLENAHTQNLRYKTAGNKAEQLRLKHNTQSATNPLLSMALAQPPKDPNILNVQESVPVQKQMTPIFKAGAPEREVQIAVDSKALKGIKDLVHRSQTHYKNANHLSNPTWAEVSRNRDHNHQQNVSSKDHSEALQTTNMYQYNHTIPPNMMCYDHRRPKPPPYNSSHIPPPNPYVAQQHYSVDEYHRQPLLQHVPVQHTQAQLYQGNAIEQYRHFELQGPNIEHTRSSVSTDSGFASPLQFNSSTNDGMVSPSDERSLGPLITHVTSLNPTVQHIPESICYVCRAPTKTKCLGCLQIYYCSNICQMVDWTTHKVACQRVQQGRSGKRY